VRTIQLTRHSLCIEYQTARASETTPLAFPVGPGSYGATDHKQEDVSSDGDEEVSASVPRVDRTLGIVALASLIFFEVAGGAYGIEPVIKTAGPLVAIVGLCLAPIFWSVPIAMMTAELATTWPCMGGKISWVSQTLGPTAGFLNGMYNCIGNFFDVAVLPVLTVDFLEGAVGPLLPLQRWLLAFSCLVLCTGLNIRGIELAGNASIAFCVAAVAPFVLLIIMGLPSIKPSIWAQALPGAGPGPLGALAAVQWRQFISVLLWNTSGYDDAAATAEEVADPGRVYPRALGLAVVVISLSYLLPVMVGVGVDPDFTDWHDGHFTQVVRVIGGSGFCTFLALAGAVSGIGQLNALLCSSARELVAMADEGLLPNQLGSIHEQWKTPWVATLGFAAVTSLCLTLSFGELVAATVFFDTLSFSFQFCTLIVLRYTKPRIPRPFRVPGGIIGAVSISVPPVLLCGVQLALAGSNTWLLGGGCTVMGLLFHVIYQRCRQARVIS